jgi:hypothetical protein
MTLAALAALTGMLAAGQCAMCFRNAEAQSRARAEALNRGILVMLTPLAGAAAVIARVAYKRRARTMGTGGARA